MEVGLSGLKGTEMAESEKDQLLLKKTTLKVVLQQCQRALELLNNAGCVDDDDDLGSDGSAMDNGEQLSEASPAQCCDEETDELYDLLKSRVECPEFLEKLENAQASIHQNMAEEGNSWDMVNENDIWEGGSTKLDQEDYVLVSQEDIVDGIACFMAAYLLSLKQTKELTPNQLQEALSKTFSVKKKKGKLRKAWEGSQVIYNVASWSATAIGPILDSCVELVFDSHSHILELKKPSNYTVHLSFIQVWSWIYQNPALLKAASSAFWTSCQAISKLF